MESIERKVQLNIVSFPPQRIEGSSPRRNRFFSLFLSLFLLDSIELNLVWCFQKENSELSFLPFTRETFLSFKTWRERRKKVSKHLSCECSLNSKIAWIRLAFEWNYIKIWLCLCFILKFVSGFVGVCSIEPLSIELNWIWCEQRWNVYTSSGWWMCSQKQLTLPFHHKQPLPTACTALGCVNC